MRPIEPHNSEAALAAANLYFRRWLVYVDAAPVWNLNLNEHPLRNALSDADLHWNAWDHVRPLNTPHGLLLLCEPYPVEDPSRSVSVPALQDIANDFRIKAKIAVGYAGEGPYAAGAHVRYGWLLPTAPIAFLLDAPDTASTRAYLERVISPFEAEGDELFASEAKEYQGHLDLGSDWWRE